MNPFWSRVLVAAIGLPAVLGVVWLGGWWLCALAVAAGLVALHEFYVMARPLRPLVLAGYTGLVLTVLGVAWIAFGLAFILLLRGLEEHGRLAVFTVLLAVFAADTMAYFVGQLIGRHKLAPVLSPGKTWEGLVGSTVVALLVPFFALYQQHFLTIGESLVLGAVIAVTAPVGDLFESAVKRDLGVKDSGRLLAGHGGVLDRLDAPLFAAVASYFVILAFT